MGATPQRLPAQTLSGFEPKRPLNQAQTRNRKDGENAGRTVEGHLVEGNRTPMAGVGFLRHLEDRAEPPDDPRPSRPRFRPPVSCTPRRPAGSLSPVPTADRRLTRSGQQLPAADQEPTLFQRGEPLTNPLGCRLGPLDARGGAWPANGPRRLPGAPGAPAAPLAPRGRPAALLSLGVSLRVGTGTPFAETLLLPRRSPVGPSVFAAGLAVLVGTALPVFSRAGWLGE